MITSLVNSVAHKYTAATNPQAGNEDDALESRLLRVVMADAKQKVEEERRFAALAAGHLDDSPAAGHADSIAPIEKSPPARKENVIVHARVPLLEAPLLPKLECAYVVTKSLRSWDSSDIFPNNNIFVCRVYSWRRFSDHKIT